MTVSRPPLWLRAAGLALPLASLLLPAGIARAAGGTALPSITVGLGSAQSPTQVASSVQILLALTVLSLAPAILLLMTSFTRIVIVLSFARSALGTSQLPPNQIIVGLALFLTLFVMGPTFQQIYTHAWQPYQAGTLSLTQAVTRAEGPLQAFMLRQTRSSDLTLFENMQKQETAAAAKGTTAASGGAAGAGGGSSTTSSGATAAGGTGAQSAPPPLTVLVPAFVVSELRTAFEMGFVLFIPFAIIDLVVGSTLMAMGMVMLPPMLISLPFKVLLFVLVDGWTLLVQSLVLSFH